MGDSGPCQGTGFSRCFRPLSANMRPERRGMAKHETTTVAQTDTLFPSGPWTGYYVHHHSPERHRMDLDLRFADGLVDGTGTDDVGRFVIRGHYDRETLVVT